MDMKENKFRVWFPDEKKMFDWVHFKYIDASYFTNLLFRPRDKIIMQFTGLLDKQGKEAYEGDIIDTEFGKYLIIFKNGAFQPDTWKFNTLDLSFTVIGNIYENSDLLTSSKESREYKH